MDNITGLVATPSLDFVKQAFLLYQQKKTFAIIKKADAHSENIAFTATYQPKPGGGWLVGQHIPVVGDEPAQIVFTSGTTGGPKAIVLSYNNLADVTQRLNRVMSIDSSIREYIGVPVTYSFGLGRCRAISAVGGEAFIPSAGFSVEEILRMLSDDQINAISAVPSQWRVLLSQSSLFGEQGRKVRWIEIGSQYMSAEEKSQLRALFPLATIVQHYGLTEASRSTFLNIHQVSNDQLESVGSPVGDVEVRIAQSGIIEIRGPHVAMGRLSEGKLMSITDADGWLATGDKGRLEGNMLYFEGRADDIINCGGVKISPELFQQQLTDRVGQNQGLAVARYHDRVRGEGILVAYEKAAGFDQKSLEKNILEVTQLYDGNLASAIQILPVSQIPRTETGKVQRNELTLMADKRQAEAVQQGDAGGLLDIYRQLFKLREVTEESSFESLNGDSINHVELAMAIEKQLGYQPAGWEALSISQLNELKKDGDQQPANRSWLSLVSLDMGIWLRVVAIFCVVATHAGLDVVGGGTLLLTVLVGYNLSKFKFNQLVTTNSFKALTPYVGKILVPYYLLTVVYFFWHGSPKWELVFMVENLIDIQTTVVFPFWFVQVLFQCFVLIALLTSIPWLSQKLQKNPWQTSFGLLLFFMGVRLVYPLFWDTTAVNNLVPTRFIGIIWIGWTAYLARNHWQKLLTAAIAVWFAYVDYGVTRLAVWLAVGVPILLYLPAISLPRMLRGLSLKIAAATFYIFIFNGIFIYVASKALGTESILVGTFVGLVSGLAAWWVLEDRGILFWLLSRLRHRKSVSAVVAD